MAGHPGPIGHGRVCIQGKGAAAAGAWRGLGVQVQGADVQVAVVGWPGQCVGMGLREGTHMGVSERGEEWGEREHTLHEADRGTSG